MERLCSKWLLQDTTSIRAHKLHDCSVIGSDLPPSCRNGTAQPIIEANVPHCNFNKLNTDMPALYGDRRSKDVVP